MNMMSASTASAVAPQGATGLVPTLLRQIPGVQWLANALHSRKPILSEEQVGQYHGAGYMIFDPKIPMSVLDQAIIDLKNHPDNVHNLHHGSRVFNGWKQSRAVRSIALNARVLRALRQLYGRTPLPFQTLNFPIGTEQKPHSDIIHFHTDPPSYMCGVWVALEDIDEGNGALVYYPGSHKLPEVKMEDFAAGPGKEHYDDYEATIAGVVKKNNLRPERAIIRKGQCLIWSANLIHGGGSHPDKHRTRHSQVTHYFFEGCQYYTPLDSYGGYRHLRQEEWIK
jgi:Phytanoyl-CoA dioxygenase (PhyH)